MTAQLQSSLANAKPDTDSRRAEHSAPTQPNCHGPLIILTYAQSGAARLQRALAQHAPQTDRRALVCTSGTGVLAACAAAAEAWHRVDGQDGPLSQLAIASIRALADSLVTAILADAGGSRWCEICIAAAGHADAFLAVNPAARVVCLHRHCSDVISAALQANPWGLAGTPFGAFVSAYPGNAVATAAAYWVAHTRALLEFEQAHQGTCWRLRYEELASGLDAIPADAAAFLGLAALTPVAGRASAANNGPLSALETAESTVASAASADPFPAERIPAELGRRLNELSAELGYGTKTSQAR
jgi:hypothetical protein